MESKSLRERVEHQAHQLAEQAVQSHLYCEECKERLKQMVNEGERARQEAIEMRSQNQEMKAWLDSLNK